MLDLTPLALPGKEARVRAVPALGEWPPNGVDDGTTRIPRVDLRIDPAVGSFVSAALLPPSSTWMCSVQVRF